jgi:hypothetical protein
VNEVAKLVQELQEAADAVVAGELAMSYAREGDVRDHNRRVDALSAVLDELAGSEDGRSALEVLMREPPADSLQIFIANVVMRWDDVAARDALEGIVTSGGGNVARPMTMTAALEAPFGAARNAALSLLNLDHPGPGRP